jgi:hypothetical protein
VTVEQRGAPQREGYNHPPSVLRPQSEIAAATPAAHAELAISAR